MNRRTFIETLGLGAVTLPGWAQAFADATAPSPAPILMPSAYFGTISPADAGFSADVTSKMSTYLQSQIDAGVIPGAFVAAMRNGKVFLEEHFGVFCDRTRRDAPYDGAAIHPFHSFSKMVSATAVVMAWQDGLIDIDTPVMKYIPEFGNGGKEPITIRMLMDHSAGIPVTPKTMMTGTEEQWKAAIAGICAESVQWPPGSRTIYHGLSGLLVSAEAVRRVSGGKTWNEICQERIFTPLGLTSFTFDQPPADLPLACIPRPAHPSAEWQTEIDRYAGEPAGGLKGSPTDVLKFLVFQTHRGTWKGQTLLQEKYWTEMHTPQFPGKPIPVVKDDGTIVKPGFDCWGFGMMLRGDGPVTEGHGWFGMKDVTRPHVFGHVGTDISMAMADPDTDTQIVFAVTDTPKSRAKAVELRNVVTDTVFNALSCGA